MSKGYTDAEIEAIALLLAEHNSASCIATWLTAARGRRVTRNAIIGIVHRDKRLKAIGLKGRSVAGPKKTKYAGVLAAPKVKPQPKRPLIEAHNIAVRLENRTLSQPLTAPPMPEYKFQPVAPPVPVTLLELQPGQCRYAVNEAQPWEGHLFCAEPSTNGSYCRKHHEICTGIGTAGERDASRALARIAA